MTFIVLFLISASAFAFLWSRYGDLAISETGPGRFLTMHWLGLIPLYFLFELFRRRVDDLYEFEIHHLTCKGGRFSLNYSVPSVKYIDIRSIRVRQDIFGRIFNYGTVEISTAAQDDNEIALQGIVGPQELAFLIEELRQISTFLLYQDIHLRQKQEEAPNRSSRRIVQSRPASSRAIA